MEWKFYITLPGFDHSGLGFAKDVKYRINDSPTKVFVGLYDGLRERKKQGQSEIAQIGHVWQYDPNLSGSLGWGAHYFMLGDDGQLTGMQNGHLGYTGEIIDISKTDANRLIKASWDLVSAYESIVPSLERCILTLEKAKRRK